MNPRVIILLIFIVILTSACSIKKYKGIPPVTKSETKNLPETTFFLSDYRIL